MTACDFISHTLVGKQIDSVYIDSEVTYIMLTDGTQISLHGTLIVQLGSMPPKPENEH